MSIHAHEQDMNNVQHVQNRTKLLQNRIITYKFVIHYLRIRHVLTSICSLTTFKKKCCIGWCLLIQVQQIVQHTLSSVKNVKYHIPSYDEAGRTTLDQRCVCLDTTYDYQNFSGLFAKKYTKNKVLVYLTKKSTRLSCEINNMYVYLNLIICPIPQEHFKILHWDVVRLVFQPLLISLISFIMSCFYATLVPPPTVTNRLQHPVFTFIRNNIPLLKYKSKIKKNK